MGHKSEAESMQELTSLMWNRYLKERVKEEQNHEMNAYKAEVVTNHGDGTLTIQRPFETVQLRLKAASSLQYAQPGDMVLVVGIGDKSKALSNAFILCKTDMTDDTTVPVYGMGKNLLRNWYFAGGGTGTGIFPVNELGLSVYSSQSLCIDGWWFFPFSGGTLTLASSGAVIAKNSATSAPGFQQFFDGIEDGRVVTISCMTTEGVQWVTSSPLSSQSGTSWQVSQQLYYSTVRVWCGLRFHQGHWNVAFTTEGATIVAVKVELGTRQTLAHLENGTWVLNELPDYEEELLKCQTSVTDPNDIYANGVVSINVPNQNLVDNWYFIGGGTFANFPVNQRAQTSYTVAGFCIDRWNSQRTTHTLTIQSDCIHWERVTNGSYNPLFYQPVKVVQGEVYTYSILYRSTFRKLRETFTTALLPEASDWTLYSKTATVSGASANIGVQDISYNQGLDDTGKYIEIKAIKLEVGTRQTLARIENGAWVINDVPNYWDELYKCQKYLKKASEWGNIYPARTDSTNLYFFITGGTMARAPSTLTSLQVYFYSGANYYILTADCSFNHYYDGIRGTMAKGTIPNNIGGSLVFSSTIYLSAEP